MGSGDDRTSHALCIISTKYASAATPPLLEATEVGKATTLLNFNITPGNTPYAAVSPLTG